VDTPQDLHVAAALDQLGRVVGTRTFPTTTAGYRRLLAWLRRHGRLERVGVEGTGSYGAALARHLTAAGVQVYEVARPNRQVRRRHGKTDVVDAIAAARAVLSGEATGTPKSHDGPVEALRTLKAVQRSGNDPLPQALRRPRDLQRAALNSRDLTVGASLQGHVSCLRPLVGPHSAGPDGCRGDFGWEEVLRPRSRARCLCTIGTR
jgi:hypothetical protein